jgi:hypothetical protein
MTRLTQLIKEYNIIWTELKVLGDAYNKLYDKNDGRHLLEMRKPLVMRLNSLSAGIKELKVYKKY